MVPLHEPGRLAFLASRTTRGSFLLVSLVLVIFVRPFLSADGLTRWLTDATLIASLVTAALAGSEHRARALLVWLLALGSVLARVAWRSTGSGPYLVTFLVSAVLLHGVVAGVLVVRLLRHRSGVTTDTIQGAVGGYLLLGMVWSHAFALLEHLEPGSFQLPPGEAEERFGRLIGFSFTTLTTLGYGYIHPVTVRAEALANAEAVTGVLYLGILISRLVGLQIAERHGPSQP